LARILHLTFRSTGNPTHSEDSMSMFRPSPATLAGRFVFAAATAGLGALLAAAPRPGAAVLGRQNPPATAAQKPADPQKPADTQKPTPEAQQQPTFRTEANFVRVDVYPTADGRAVQDLQQGDFEVLEDGKPQEVRTFEHVVIQAAGPQETRSDPKSVTESRDMAADPRARLFILFLDTYHVGRSGAYTVRRSLSRMLDRVIGQNDLVAVMTPEMSAGAVTFTRRTGTIDELLDRWITWGKRHEEVMNPDPVESRYQYCYPPGAGETGISAIAQEMIARRREQMTLDAMRDLIGYLTGLREERKAILMVSEGWALYRPNSALARPVDGRIPGPQPVGVGVTGGLQMGDGSRNAGGATSRECDTDRMMLSQEDHERQFRELLDEANRGNSSFYTIDPRGLPVFDNDIGPGQPPPVNVDMAMLQSRQEALRTLAVATDGLAVMNSNDIDKGLRRIVDDLTSYYLLGYYSTNAKADGRFHSISVKVKRPGVNVRARRGYRSPTREEMEGERKAVAAAAARGTDVSPATRAVGALSKVRPDAFVHAAIGYEWRPSPSGAPSPSLWVITELDSNAPAREEAYRAGADVAITVTGGDKSTVNETQQTLKREQRSAILRVPLPDTLPGDYAVRITSKPAGGVLGSTETLRIMVPRLQPESLVLGQPLLYRRGPFSGPAWQIVGDPRYRRQERVKMEVPALGAVTGVTVVLLDRTGKPLSNIPVVSATRDENGQTIVSGEVVLAPLTTGDYVLEATIKTATAETKVTSAFRIVP
jgi:VWFA-related protein